ncbi:UNVERIFIED_CONTAM: hypothetical protein Sangu_2171400 [Sesamum angustifolium]|uniref:Uncharacterized protein n=1 Tax=Sesamum angustifolium TaxID=2727405 RepID=A0AAW2LHA5_9LAMI
MDRRIPLPLSFQPITAPNTLHLEATLAELLDEASEWKEGLIRVVFRNEDVEAILGITADTARPNQLRWHYEKNGRYTAKSAYRLFSQGLVMRAAGGGMVRHLISL